MPATASSPHKRLATLLLLAAWLAVSQACVLRPAWQTLAAEGQLQSRWLDGAGFRHRVLANGVRGKQLRIYIEGDGGPWMHGSRVSVDPTPANPLLLRLMHKSAQPAVYLGRPCYFGAATDEGCGPELWTFDRYGRAVVDSMCEAANRLSRELDAESVELIGYSGGGAVVIGMAGCTERLQEVITIAGNLDPDAWTRHHGYAPLNDLSPLKAALRRSTTIGETHWQCRDDANVPPSITDGYFAARPAAVRRIVDACSHAAGWEQYWPQIAGSDD